jgi:uncharacterized protein YlbG (UPF0298 family)
MLKPYITNSIQLSNIFRSKDFKFVKCLKFYNYSYVSIKDSIIIGYISANIVDNKVDGIQLLNFVKDTTFSVDVLRFFKRIQNLGLSSIRFHSHIDNKANEQYMKVLQAHSGSREKTDDGKYVYNININN